MRSSRRSRAICAAAARIFASCARSHAPRAVCREMLMSSVSMSRRDLLKTGGSLIVLFSLPVVAKDAVAGVPAGKPVSLDRVESFLAIGADGTVTCYSGKVDLGTGVETALTQIVAEEL